MIESTFSVRDDGDLHRYRTEIPNIIFRLGLTPYELTLYAHLKQTAGDGGQCWKSTGTLARETGMSAGTISKAKDGLTESRPELAGKSLIAVRKDPGHNGGRPRHYITLTDVWPENMTMRGRVEGATSTGNSPSSPHELGVSQVHHTNAQVHHMNFPSSPHELKKEQSIKKELKEEEESPTPLKKATLPPGAARAKKPSPVSLSPPANETPKRVKFVAPTLEEITADFAAKGRGDLAAEWYGYWDSRDWWRAKGIRMSKWKIAVSGWIASKTDESGQPLTSRRFPAAVVDTSHEAMIGRTLDAIRGM